MANMSVRLALEETYGVRPAGALQFYEYTDFSIQSSLKRGTPNDANRDRQRRSNPAEKIEVSGSATADAFLQTHLIEMQSAFCNTWSESVSAEGIDISASAVDNKLVKPGGWGNISGGFVWVQGFAVGVNGPAFLAHVLSVDGDDLNLDPAFDLVVDEAAGDNVKVYRTRDLVLGKDRLSITAEQWDATRGRGFEYNGLGCSAWSLKGGDGIMTQDMSFVGGRKEKRLIAQLLNGSTEAPVDTSFDFLAHATDPLNTPGSNLGLRYGNEFTDLRIEELGVSLENPLLATYGAGAGGNGVDPVDMILDGEFTCKADLKAFRDGGADIEALLDAAEDPNSEEPFGFGIRTPTGVRYIWMEAAQISDAKSTDGLKKDGESMVDNLTFNPRHVSGAGLVHVTDIVFAN